MKKDFKNENWKSTLPIPVCKEHSEFSELYMKAWELAHSHIRDIPGMPQSPYMDEAFCDTQIWIWDTCFMSQFTKYAREVFPGVESFDNFYSILSAASIYKDRKVTGGKKIFSKTIYKIPRLV